MRGGRKVTVAAVTSVQTKARTYAVRCQRTLAMSVIGLELYGTGSRIEFDPTRGPKLELTIACRYSAIRRLMKPSERSPLTQIASSVRQLVYRRACTNDVARVVFALVRPV